MREKRGRRETYLKPLHHVVGIHLDSAHVELHGADVLEHLGLCYAVMVTADEMFLLGLLVRLVAGFFSRGLVVLLLECVQHLELLAEKSLGIYRLNLQLGRVGVAPGELERVHARVLHGFFVQGDCGPLGFTHCMRVGPIRLPVFGSVVRVRGLERLVKVY